MFPELRAVRRMGWGVVDKVKILHAAGAEVLKEPYDRLRVANQKDAAGDLSGFENLAVLPYMEKVEDVTFCPLVFLLRSAFDRVGLGLKYDKIRIAQGVEVLQESRHAVWVEVAADIGVEQDVVRGHLAQRL